MSLESALKENTETMRELIEVLTRTNLPEAQAAASKAESAPKEKPAAKEGKAKPAAKPAAKKEEPSDAYAPVQEAILAAVKDGHRGTVTELLNDYSAKTGRDLSEDVYDEFLAALAERTGSEGDLA